MHTWLLHEQTLPGGFVDLYSLDMCVLAFTGHSWQTVMYALCIRLQFCLTGNLETITSAQLQDEGSSVDLGRQRNSVIIRVLQSQQSAQDTLRKLHGSN